MFAAGAASSIRPWALLLDGPRAHTAVSFGKDAGPHNLVLSSDDNRLMVSDYLLNEDAAGKLGAGTAALDVWLGHRGGLRRILRRSQFTAFRSLGVEAVE